MKKATPSYRRFAPLLPLLLALASLTACTESRGIDDEVPPERSIYARLAVLNRFKTFLAAVDKAGLAEELKGGNAYTVFAASDSAFRASKVDIGAFSAEQLRAVLSYHLLPGAVRIGDLPNGYVTTVNGGRIWLKRDINPVTKFATVLDVNERRVSSLFAGFPQTNLYAANGFINEIDVILTPPAQSVLQLVETHPELTSLNGALAAAGLKAALAGNGPVTLFAPNNAAFAAANLGALTPEQLTDVLLYHVADARIGTTTQPDLLYAKDLTNNRVVPTLRAGSTLKVTVAGTAVKLNGDATVVTPNANATNGVVHIIDKVLMP
jgi:transforming growth factor-beta-induced protein